MEFTQYFIIPPIHPLLPATISLILGITTYHYTQFALHLPLLLAFSLVLLFIHYILAQQRYLFILCAAFWILGIWLLAQQYRNFSDFHDKFSGPVSIRAAIVAKEPIDHPRFRYKISLNMAAIKSNHEATWHPSGGSLLAYTCRSVKIPIDDIVEIDEITLKKPASSFAHYLIKEGCVASHCTPFLKCHIVEHKSWTIRRYIDNLRHRILRKLQATLAPETFELVSSIFLGNRSYVKKSMDITKEHFKIWGISHYLARSGLHVVLFIMLWQWLLSLLPLSYRTRQGTLILLIILYALLSWSSVSFERALLMFLLYKGCTLLGYPSNYIHTITLATLFILFCNPSQLFFLDFQLSFGFTFALAWFAQLEAEKRRLKTINA